MGLLTVGGRVLLLNGAALFVGPAGSSTPGSGGGSGGGTLPAAPLAATFLPQTLPTSNFSLQSFGSVLVTGGLGRLTFALSVPNTITDTNYFISTAGVLTLYNGSNSVSAGRVDAISVTVTDSTGASVTVATPVSYVGAARIVPSHAPVFYDSQNVSKGVTFVGLQAYGAGFDSNANVQITDPTGYFSGSNFIGPNGTAWPAPGNYPVMLSVSENGQSLSSTVTVQVIHDPGPALIQWTQNTLSAARIPGTVVGTALADGSTSITTYSLSNSNGGRYSINGLTGVVSVAAALVAGTDSITIVATRNGLTLSKQVSIVIGPGSVLPAANMTMTVATNLTNFVLNPSTPRIVGTPSVVGISGTPQWSMDQTMRCVSDEDPAQGHGHARYVIDPASGQVTAIAQLSALVNATTNTQTDVLTLTCTDGVNSCTQQFNVVVTAVVGPTIYIGRGMASAHGSNGYDHIAQWMATVQTSNASMAGATVLIYSDSDPDYYANDNGGNLDPRDPGDYGLRYGLHGPLIIKGMQGSGGPRPRLGGVKGSVAAGSGVDMGSKGFFVISDGDFVCQNIDFSDVHYSGYQGASVPGSGSAGCAIRQNGAIWGNVCVDSCSITDCDQGIETGGVPCQVTINNVEVSNSGGVYQGSGATHCLYIGACAKLVVNGLLSWRTFNGHTLKTRAASGTINNARLFDGERGAASCQLEIPDGGTYVVTNSVFHKGTQPANPNSIQFCAEMLTPNNTAASLTLQNCTLITNTPSGNAGLSGVFHYGQCLLRDGSYSSVTTTGCTYVGYTAQNAEVATFDNFDPPSVVYATAHYATAVSDGRPCTVNSTGRVLSSVQPALDFTNPATGVATSPRPGPFYFPYDGENRPNFLHSYGVQIDPGVDDIRAIGASVGAVIFSPSATGCPYYKSNPTQPDPNINPFSGGATWAIVAGAGPYVGGTYGVAPVGRYSINASTGAVSLAQAVPAGTVDNLIISATAAGSGVIVQQGFYIVH